MNQRELRNVKAKLDNKNTIILPLDYSFRGLSTFDDLLKEKQRVRGQREQDMMEELEGGVPKIVQSLSPALKVNNNMLNIWEDFSSVIKQLFVDPAQTLGWLDFSFNDFRTIDNALLELPNLTMLYLHGNNIFTIAQVDKLSSLKKLKSLTLHGNPVEVTPGYRPYVIYAIPQLQTFDFSGITGIDRVTAERWKGKHITIKSKKKKDEDT